jgi:hypothetical protein
MGGRDVAYVVVGLMLMLLLLLIVALAALVSEAVFSLSRSLGLDCGDRNRIGLR